MANPTASISARPIAAGINGGKVRIVIALMPVKGADVPLDTWPQAVEEKLADGLAWRLYALPAVHAPDGTRPVPPTVVAGLTPIPLDGATVHAYGDRRGGHGKRRLVEQAVGLWQWVMGEGATGIPGGSIWDGLSGTIAQAADFKAPDPLRVAAVRRADAALYYSVARARSLFRRDRTAPPDPSTLTPFDSSKTKDAANKDAADALAADRENDPVVVKVLADTVALGQAQAATRRRYLAQHAKWPDILSATSDPAGIGPALSLPAEVIGAALDGNHDDPLAKELRALHVATTLDDTVKKDANGKALPRADGATLRDFDNDSAGAAQLLPSLQRAPQLLFALRANPTLARLFRFVIDVEIPVEALVTVTGGDPAVTKPSERFVFLAATFGNAAPVWVVTKLSFEKGVLTQAWPALRTEMDLSVGRPPGAEGPGPAGNSDVDRAKRLAVSQSDGLIRFGQGLDDSAPWSRHARYEFATLDPAFAVESDIRRSKLRQALVDNAARQGKGVNPASLAGVPDPSIISRGLVVLDSWRQSAVVSEIVTAAAFCQSCGGSDATVVDAEDLATGLAIHVAAPIGEAMGWRSQMHRRIAYADPRSSSPIDVEALLAALGLERDGPWRIQSDGASVTTPSRNRETADAPVVHVEESLCSIEGDPLALSCKTEHAMAVAAGADLAIDRAYSLATSGKDRFVPVRFGWPYKIGAGPIWAGGVSVPTEMAAAMFDRDPTLTLPSASPALSANASMKGLLAVRRFLRHEALGPPVVLLPLHLAVREDERVRQTGPVVILRENVEADRTSWRLLVPPHISLDDAWRHGVFDGDPDPSPSALGKPPRDGLAEVDWDEPWGGFPVFGRLQSEGAPTRAGLTRLASNPDKRPRQKGALPPPPDEAGQPVFESRRPGSVRALPYYPDPAAEELVIALRPVAAAEQGEDDLVRATDCRPYFEGVPVVVPLRKPGADFRDALPVAVEFRRIDAHRQAAPTQENLFVMVDAGRRYAERYADGRSDRLDRAGRRGDAKILAVQIGLCKGEHVAADCWFVPTEAKLRGWFDLPETLAMLGGADLKGLDADAYDAIEGALDLEKGALLKASKGVAAAGHRTWLGSAGLPIRERILATVAHYLSGELRRKPMPQLAGVLSIEAAHAVLEPRPPEFLIDATLPQRPAYPPARKALDLTRYDTGHDQDGSGRLKLLQGYQQSRRWAADVPPRATGILLAGDVLVDRDASGDLEVVALCASPQTAKMDDTDRKRTDQQRLEGVWPKTRRGALGGPAAGERVERSDEVFGFKVDPSGAVELQRVEVTLLRLDGFAARIDQPASEGLDAMSLVDEQVKAIGRKPITDDTIPVPDAPRVTAFDPFKDRLARRLKLGLRASSRYLPLLESIVADRHSQLPSSPPPVPRSLPANFADGPVVWVPATQRPSAPAVHSALPQPIRTGSNDPDEAGCARWTRTCSTRVWLERPWFSSGEGERLGIVVWPPRTGKLAENKLLQGLVERSPPRDGAPAEPGDEPYMAMATFADDDLGPGGKFVTRWGADPIRAATGPRGPFIPASALVDIDKSLQDALFDETLTADARTLLVGRAKALLSDPPDARIGYVANIPVPIFPDGTDDRDADPVATIMADLITYLPRFDPDSERWFVDVTVDPRAPQDLVEPFLRLGLVRYQAHALEKPDLRTSAPATAWVQVLPLREALVWRDPDGAIVVQIAGPITAHIDGEKLLREPRLRIALVSELLLESGIATTAVILQRAEDGNGPASEPDGWVTVSRGSPQRQTAAAGGAWVRRLTDQDASGGGQDVSLFVLIEELEEFPSTDDEAVEDALSAAPTAGAWTVARPGERVSGPRFAAKIAVPTTPAVILPPRSAPPVPKRPIPSNGMGGSAPPVRREHDSGAEATAKRPNEPVLKRSF